MHNKVKCIVHFLPVEKYPPAINFLKILAADKELEIHLVTVNQENGKKKLEIPGVRIHRFGAIKNKRSSLSRMFFYIGFFFRTLLLLIRVKPSSLLYYESISAGAPCIYKKWFNKSCRLFIHNHEYKSPQELNSGIFFNRWVYKIERSVFKKADWVSHTNEDRMRFFLNDMGKDAPTQTHILPNHPPVDFGKYAKDSKTDRKPPVGIVYIGALSVDEFFLKEMATWVASNPSNCYWDIYSDNYQPEVLAYLKELNAPNISFKGGVEYSELSKILPKYTVGIILYTGHIPNYVYNVPNKLFEYHVCGLDTWFPDHMISCHELDKPDSYPKIIGIDFKELEKQSLEKLVCVEGLPYLKNEFIAEKTYQPLIQAFTNSN